jgi:1,2-diacylglycerol 3-alpha-glucosyltransferase
MKILISSLTYSLPNGVTVSIDSTIDGLINKGHEVIVISPRYKKTNHRPEHYQVSFSLAVKTIGSLIGKDERTFSLTSFREIDKIALKFKPDLYWLHTVSWAANAFEKYMLKSDKIKILHYHTLVEEYGRLYGKKWGADLMRQRSKIISNKVDAVITPSNVIKEKLNQYGVKKPIHVIPTGIAQTKNYFSKKQLCQKFNLDLNSKILLYVGRVCKEKNIESLFKLMKGIKKKQDNVFLIIIGPGEIDKFKETAQTMKVLDKVIFAGSFPLEETRRMYQASDVFVFASKTETQGLVIGEAMMAETAVVALDSSIQPEIYPEQTAIVVRNEANFPEAVLNILEDSGKREKMIKKAKDFVMKNFSQEATTEKQIKLFSSLYKK